MTQNVTTQVITAISLCIHAPLQILTRVQHVFPCSMCLCHSSGLCWKIAVCRHGHEERRSKCLSSTLSLKEYSSKVEPFANKANAVFSYVTSLYFQRWLCPLERTSWMDGSKFLDLSNTEYILFLQRLMFMPLYIYHAETQQ